MKLSIGFSPCPNDTFIFDALVNNKIDTGGLEFEPVIEDVETLNELAIDGKLDITKLSFPAFFKSVNSYLLLDSGSALGKGVGPLLVSYKDYSGSDVSNKTIAIPGLQTTANFLLDFAFPGPKKKITMLFSAIEDAVITGRADLGVIIHENRFTYREKGLKLVKDLGAAWEYRMNIPVPLGGIAVNRRIDKSIASGIESLIKQSLDYSYKSWPVLSAYVRSHSQTMSEEVMRKHIDLYVNEYSKTLGEKGRRAIEGLYKVFLDQHTHQVKVADLFLS
jgi:1,4-dihydroxy-6-naphthoate synthase